MTLPTFFLIQNALLVLVIIGLVLTRSRTRSELVVRLIAAWILFFGALAAGLWYYPPSIGKIVYAFAFLGATVIHIYRSDQSGSLSLFRLQHSPTLLCACLGAVLLWQGLIGRSAPAGKYIDLVSPMKESDGVCVMSGGASLALNLHYLLALSPEGRYEQHSIDFTRQDDLGVRTRSLWVFNPQPQELDEYLVLNQPVFAPCSGPVVSSENNKEDHPAGDRFRDTSGSNHVTLQCDNRHIVLAHLKKGTVTVEEGQIIEAGTQIGLVGNSGNTEEPHLHINAQTIISPDDTHTDREPVLMRFNGKYLSRGDCL